MSPVLRKKIGGLVLKTQELEVILAEPNTVGLAFALATPGEASNVQLKVLRVYEDGTNLVGEERNIHYRAGAEKALQHPVGQPEDFIFRYNNKLKSDGYGFGFYAKESFQRLFKPGFDEVFIGGGKVDYGDKSYADQSEWFTFTISLRKSIPIVHATNGKKTDFTWNGHATIQLPKANKKQFIGVDTIRNTNPENPNIDEEIDSLVLGSNNLVEGIIFRTDKEKTPIRLEPQPAVNAVLTTEDGTLRRLYINQNETPDILVLEEEERLLGLFPNFGHMIGCPPRWEYDGLKDDTNTIKKAVRQALNKTS